jgi:hypothetical protein
MRGVAVASVSFGYWSLCTFWWYPFGLLMATAGISFAVGSILVGLRGGKRGENLALIGLALSLTGFAIGATLNFGIHVAMGTRQ